MNTYEPDSLSGISVYLRGGWRRWIEKEAQHLNAAEARSTCEECDETCSLASLNEL
jgi:hypothetical protein